MTKLSAARGAGKLSQTSKLWKDLDTQFKDHILENQNCLFKLLSIINEEPEMMTSFVDSLFDGEYYDSGKTTRSFVENLDQIDDYARGAALLAYVYNGISRYKEAPECYWDQFEEPPESVIQGEPWLPWIVREINKKMHNHYAKWKIDSRCSLSQQRYTLNC
ncbi:hypothetical protein OROHE_000531 [Orobanche hederae]